ncbi:LOW QUALITY PROTEIN: probable long-chain-alcohol O-fatty-acyltransferase 6, partial [Arabidopsis lyrata subsp. lyrata]|uniref:LOW QUALITY PROTEIN: probable long-chain-alcohol O-fatty-acyltransferase 6 n=1 Tax=Arabidopsis lyrata subsp. lyrata TaxID=81972 RepID=UPI000A29C0F7
MEEELKIFIEVWVSAIISVTYCYYLPPKIKTNILRLLSVLPVCALFLALPMFFSTVHFSFTIAFFLSGLAVPKLILFALEKGPLFPLPPNLLQFICFACFPIKFQINPNPGNPNFPKWVFALKVFIFGALLLQVYDYKQFLPPNFLLGLYALHIYLELEISLTLIKFLVSITLGCDLEPQFNEPYLATSLYDFWGH